MKVVIAGGGPAGSTAAYWLAAHGHEVVVLEKTAHPREKVCGAGVGDGLGVLAQLRGRAFLAPLHLEAAETQHR